MTIEQAFEQLMNGTEYSTIAKQKDSQGSKYRVMRSRYNKGQLKALAMVEMLLKYGYTVIVKKGK